MLVETLVYSTEQGPAWQQQGTLLPDGLSVHAGVPESNGERLVSGDVPDTERDDECVPESTAHPKKMQPPVASKKKTVHSIHGEDRVDPWAWLREKENPEVLAHLEAENQYVKEALRGNRALEEEIYQEVKGRIVETDMSAPVLQDGYWYYKKTQEGKQHASYWRRRETEEREELLIDLNEEAGEGYIDLSMQVVARDTKHCAHGVDRDGSELYELTLRDLTSGETLHQVEGVAGAGAVWSKDAKHLLYVRPDAQMRPYEVHLLNVETGEDTVIHVEEDPEHYLQLEETTDGAYLLIVSASKTTSEVHYLPSDQATNEPVCLRRRESGVEYRVDHHHQLGWITTTNKDAEGFKVVLGDVGDEKTWRDLVAHEAGVRVEGAEAHEEYIAVQERKNGLSRIRILDALSRESYHIEQEEDVSTVEIGANPEYRTSKLRYAYVSFTTPASVMEHSTKTKKNQVIKQQEVLGYDPKEYQAERTWATGHDGTLLPVDLVYKAGVLENGPAPTLVYGYGSYEASIDPYFSPFRISLLDRGVVFALIHPRGGGEMGRKWYEEGKLAKKKNTFLDAIASTEHLVETGVADPGKICLRGGSAGGLLVGAVLNMRPELYKAAVADVPFVDCLTTMLDDSIPLTTAEYTEWGNPNLVEEYHWIREYSPYDNVAEKAYPSIFVNAGLNDPRVGYWEPAKWVQKLREETQSGRVVLLKTEMGAGHGGPAGRYDAWRDEAENMVFILRELGAV